MKRNVGTVDSLVRIILGIGLLAWAFTSSSAARWWGLIGLLPLATALLRVCPLYALFGIRTCAAADADFRGD